MQELSRKNKLFTDSVIRRMTRISIDCGAINLAQGFPDFDPPKEITDRLAEVASEGPHQYALTWGAQNFREALARKQEHFYGMKVNPDEEIVVTCGSTEAMMAAMMTPHTHIKLGRMVTFIFLLFLFFAIFYNS